MSSFGQIFFTTDKWKDAFQCWDDNQHLYEGKIQMVINTNFFTSGYWIEDIGKELAHGDIVYDSNKKVQALKARIESEIDRAESDGCSPQFVN
ncbi:hypothetical protein DYBT9275_02751 [Dyadobacter sp. CECT 9275]|uniref:Uncharacterized protein n=1 Tax=Dyadobacter helix TaxID=2822344 RepID=A0A916NLM7_9BACT|nr:hypothetical protein [Dyadobacter sp. CECT 9275]CAG5001837.1 hypothetical protein DYBT9275_02751 [Dyadobacter sp. CECT 9275]